MAKSGFKEEKKPSHTQHFQWGSWFKKKPQSTPPTELLPLATQAGHFFVHGGEEEVAQGLALVEQNPKILESIVVIKDRKKRQLRLSDIDCRDGRRNSFINQDVVQYR